MQLIVSPHLDDAVLSCGGLLARSVGAHIITVFAGRPRAGLPAVPTDWDRECGFNAGDDVVGMRREEDAAACAVLGAVPVWLDFVDGQYGEHAPLDAITAALDDVLTRLAPDDVFVPLGLLHRDHERAHRACVPIIGQAGRSFFAYEDIPYRAARDRVEARVAELDVAGLRPRPVDFGVDGRDPVKARALACYRSQVGPLERSWPGYDDVVSEERYWSLGA